jgi:CBS domain-containing protein
MAHTDTQRRPQAGTVGDVMTTPVVAVYRITPYKEIARLLARYRIGGLPVLFVDQRVVGVVSEADLLAARDKTAWRARTATADGHRKRGRARRRPARTAGELMTTPAITISREASIATAARVMTMHRIGRLPVVGKDGRLIGIVSRGDLLSVFPPPASQSGGVRVALGTHAMGL